MTTRDAMSSDEQAALTELRELCGSVAHELNNVLAAVAGYADLLNDPSLPEQARADAAEILLATERGRALSLKLSAAARG